MTVRRRCDSAPSAGVGGKYRACREIGLRVGMNDEANIPSITDEDF